MFQSMVITKVPPMIFIFFLLLLFLHGCISGDASSVYPLPVVYPNRARQISWKPRAFLYESFLNHDECNYLISLARSELKRSAVADNLSGKSTLNDGRTSYVMFISKGKDPIVTGIEDKIAAWTFLPKENGEDIQVLRYQQGQKYEHHYDYFTDNVHNVHGGHRIATVLMYLTDVWQGGETVFPLAEDGQYRGKNVKDETLSECSQKGIAVTPKKGDALLFFSLHPNATTDSMSLHAGCPVLKGEKWSATKWIRVASFDKIYYTGGKCMDHNDSCAKWAVLGECTKNPEYMVGTAYLPGFCRRSCNLC